MKKFFIASFCLAAALVASACNRESPPPASTTPAPVPEAPREEAQAAAVPPPAAAPVNAVDACAMLTQADAASVLGTLTEPPKADPPQGSMWGLCNYSGEQGVAIVSAYPAGEFEGTLRYAGKQTPTRAISGLGERAVDTSSGVMLQPAGKPYFLQVFVIQGAKGYDPVMAEALARMLKI